MIQWRRLNEALGRREVEIARQLVSSSSQTKLYYFFYVSHAQTVLRSTFIWDSMGGRLSTPSHADRDREREQANGGRSYSGFLISDHARVHNGDQYTIQNYFSRSVPSPDFVLQESRPSSYAESALASRKRKRLETASYVELPRQNANHNLHLAAGQLGEFSLSLQHQKQDQDAQRVARWIRILLDAMEANGSCATLEHEEGELASLRDGLVFVDRVSVNSPLIKQRLATLPLVRKKRRTSIVTVGGLQIHLDTLTSTSLDALGENIIQTTSVLQVAPTAPFPTGTPNFAVIFGERTDSVQRSIIHPTILAYRTVSSGSAAFVLLFQGDNVDGLIRLLATQQATLRDCDVLGRSLLAVGP